MALLLLCAASARAYDFSSGGLYYNIITSTDSVMVTTSSTYSGDIVIPETVEDNGTTYIVKGVEDYAFEGSSIRSVDLSNVSTIGEYSFSCCNLLDSLTIGSKITEIPKGAFYGTSNANISPNGSNSIKYLTIPSQITSIGDYAFHYPNSLVKIEFADNSQCTRIGAQAFSTDEIITTASTQYEPMTYYKELDIPESVKFIGDSCFWGSACLETITLHEGLDSIGAGAFSGYEYYGYFAPIITEITIPSTVTYIGDYAFRYTSQLKTVTYNAVAVKNGNEKSSAFGESDTRITKLVIGPKVREIPVGMFYRVTDTTGNLEIEWNAERCEYLGKNCLDKAGPVTLTIGEDVKELYTTTDSDGNELEEPVGLFVSIDSPGTGLGLTSLTTMNFNATDCTIAGTLDAIPFTITSSNYNDNKDEDKNILPAFPLATVNFGDNVKTIPAHLLNGSSSYVKTGTSSSAGTYVNEFPYLTAITIPDNVENIGDSAFFDCPAITDLRIGKAMKTIGIDAFGEDTGISEVTYDAANCTTPQTSGEDSATSVFAGCDDFKKLTIDKDVETIPAYMFNQCSAIESLVFSATNCTSVTSDSDYPVFNGCTSLANVTISEGVTAIPDSLFDGSWTYTNSDDEETVNGFPNITSITFPSTLTSIGNYSFYDCKSLENITIPDAVTTIGKHGFDSCTALETLTIGTGTLSVGDSCFIDCSKLSTVYENRPVSLLQTQVPTAGTNCFANTPTNCWLVVPEDAAELYGSSHRATKAADGTGWATINHMREDKITITMADADGYVTRYSPYSYTTDENVTGCIVTSIEEINRENQSEDSDEGITFGLVTMYVNTSGTSIPAGTPVLLKGAENSVGTSYVNYTFNDDSPATVSGTNYLHGTVDSDVTTNVSGDAEADSETYYFYRLTVNKRCDEGSHGFYWGADNGAPFDATPDKVWMALPKSVFVLEDGTEVSSIKILNPIADTDEDTEFEDSGLENLESDDATTTGICNVLTDTQEKVIYNMAGQRVNEMSRAGVYIINGRKVIKK